MLAESARPSRRPAAWWRFLRGKHEPPLSVPFQSVPVRPPVSPSPPVSVPPRPAFRRRTLSAMLSRVPPPCCLPGSIFAPCPARLPAIPAVTAIPTAPDLDNPPPPNRPPTPLSPPPQPSPRSPLSPLPLRPRRVRRVPPPPPPALAPSPAPAPTVICCPYVDAAAVVEQEGASPIVLRVLLSAGRLMPTPRERTTTPTPPPPPPPRVPFPTGLRAGAEDGRAIFFLFFCAVFFFAVFPPPVPTVMPSGS